MRMVLLANIQSFYKPHTRISTSSMQISPQHVFDIDWMWSRQCICEPNICIREGEKERSTCGKKRLKKACYLLFALLHGMIGETLSQSLIEVKETCLSFSCFDDIAFFTSWISSVVCFKQKKRAAPWLQPETNLRDVLRFFTFYCLDMTHSMFLLCIRALFFLNSNRKKSGCWDWLKAILRNCFFCQFVSVTPETRARSSSRSKSLGETCSRCFPLLQPQKYYVRFSLRTKQIFLVNMNWFPVRETASWEYRITKPWRAVISSSWK